MAYLFREDIFYNFIISNFKNELKISKYSCLKKILIMISATENFTFKIGKSRVVENIFPEKISHDL